MGQPIHDSTKLLLSSIELPEDAVLQYAVYSSPALDALQHIESARRRLLETRTDSLFEAPIPHTHFQAGIPLLYLFKVVSAGDEAFDVTLAELSKKSFGEIELPEAASARMLCPENHAECRCSHSKPPPSESTKESNIAQRLFLDAVRDVLIDEICLASRGDGHIPAVKLDRGFCLLARRKGSEWTSKWDKGLSNGILYCELQLHLTSTHILIYPIPRRILSLSLTERAVAGSTVILLPSGTPAFYVGPHTANDKTISDFSESLVGHGGTPGHLSKEFIRCFVPVRRINDHQDGGITTVWPRSMTLVSSIRSLVSNTASTQQSPITAQSPSTAGELQLGVSNSLNALSLHSNADLSALSSAMGIFVDSSLREREKPRNDAPRTTSAPLKAADASLLLSPPNHAPGPQEMSNTSSQTQLLPTAAQNYPSPLEPLTDRAQMIQEPSKDHEVMNVDGIAPNDIPTTLAAPASEQAEPVAEPVVSQPAFATAPAPMDTWDSLGFGSSDFTFSGDGGMNFDPFSADMFTDDDFNIFDVATVQDTTSLSVPGVDAALGNGSDALPDVLMALSGGDHQNNDFGKLDASFLGWDLPVDAALSSFDVQNHAQSQPDARKDGDILLGLGSDALYHDPSGSPSKPSQVPGVTPVATVETPYVHFDLTISSPMPVELDSDEEIEFEEPGFGAVNFGRDHGTLDQKYSNGKYSLPSPPPDDRPRSANFIRSEAAVERKPERGNGGRAEPWKSTTARDGHLRARYMEATHPSRAMLFQLAGSKRNWGLFSMSQTGGASPTEPISDVTASPSKKRRLTWSMSGETWRNPTPPMDESEDEGDDAESSIAGEDEWSGDFDLGVLGIDTDAHNRQQRQEGLLPPEDPTKLLQAHFNYDWILKNAFASPSDIPLPNVITPHVFSSRRSSIPPAPVSVPTPVSPEAISGHTGNDNPVKLSLSVAQQVAKQVECNPLWNSVTTAIKIAYSSYQLQQEDIWQGEVDALSKSLRKLRWTDWDMTIADCAESDDLTPGSPEARTPASKSTTEHSFESVQPIHVPKVLLGHGSNVVESLPTILRYWDKVHVTPLNGAKDVQSIAITSDVGGIQQVALTLEWIHQVGKVYAARRLGTHTIAQLSASSKGVIPIRWDGFRLVCDQLVVLAKRSTNTPLVVYVIVPNTFANLSHSAAPQVLATISDINSSLRGTSTYISFQLIPEVFVLHATALAHNPTFGMERLAMMVYDSIPRSTVRQHSRLSAQKYPVREDTNAFAFSLAQRQASKITFTEKWPPPAASMFDRYNFLHIGYSVAPNSEWVAAVATTETGDGQESLVWEIDEHDGIGSIVKGVLDFTLKMASKADVEWRVTITKNEAMSTAELDVWTSELHLRTKDVPQAMHLTLMCVTTDNTPPFVTTPELAPLSAAPVPVARSASKDSTVILETSSNVFIMFPRRVGIVTTSIDAVVSGEFVGSDTLEANNHMVDLPMTPVSTSWLVYIFRRPDWAHRRDEAATSNSTTSVINNSTNSTTFSCQIHALHLVQFGNSTYSGETEEHMRNITTNFYDLTVLNEMRRGSVGIGKMRFPLHIALAGEITSAIDSIRI